VIGGVDLALAHFRTVIAVVTEFAVERGACPGVRVVGPHSAGYRDIGGVVWVRERAVVTTWAILTFSRVCRRQKET